MITRIGYREALLIKFCLKRPVKNKNKGIKNFFLGFIFFLIPLLWFFKILTAWKVLGLLILYFLILTGIINNNKTKSN